MSSNEEQTGTLPPQLVEIENGIFNMVIVYCQQLEGFYSSSEYAREHVASYLERLAGGLRAVRNEQENEQ